MSQKCRKSIIVYLLALDSHKKCEENNISVIFPAFLFLFIFHKKMMLLIQMISCNFQCFAKSLEMHHFSFTQETQRCQNIWIICQINQIFIGTACFLFCCTIVSRTCYVNKRTKIWRILCENKNFRNMGRYIKQKDCVYLFVNRLASFFC